MNTAVCSMTVTVTVTVTVMVMVMVCMCIRARFPAGKCVRACVRSCVRTWMEDEEAGSWRARCECRCADCAETQAAALCVICMSRVVCDRVWRAQAELLSIAGHTVFFEAIGSLARGEAFGLMHVRAVDRHARARALARPELGPSRADAALLLVVGRCCRARPKPSYARANTARASMARASVAR